MNNVAKRFATTVRYVTCIPAFGRSRDQLSQVDLSGLAKYLPAAGVLIGLGLCLVFRLLNFWHAPNILCGVILAVTWLSLTGGIHFDGLMDTADGIFSHQSVERMLEIMRDSRVGNYGVMVGMSTLLLKAACLSSLSSETLLTVLLLCPVWARWSETFAIGNFPYLRESGMGKVWHDTMSYPEDLLKGALVPLATTITAAVFRPLDAVTISLATVLAGYLAALTLARKFGGHTGDTYGAVVELAEMGGLLVTALFL
ncbi:MAG: adenosylcobinamide-GDP ribazoletransferase [Candidatus Melainabacteria bacterium]|nr:MAG: adenosylcobinamide-GDP ribazoletransferase [Candidatus Melainabacteria bacterium]